MVTAERYSAPSVISVARYARKIPLLYRKIVAITEALQYTADSSRISAAVAASAAASVNTQTPLDGELLIRAQVYARLAVRWWSVPLLRNPLYFRVMGQTSGFLG